jgi:exo-beta-1,3-glucanase (GH17 family)
MNTSKIFTSRVLARLTVALLAVVFVCGCSGTFRIEPRAFRPYLGDRWIGSAVSYGPYRDGQRPAGPQPSAQEIRQDLSILLRHWNLIRTYGAREAETILQVIRDHELPMKVMLGAWIDTEVVHDESGNIIETRPEVKEANEAELSAAIRLANAYPGVVVAVSIGNETQVFWTSHKVQPETLLDYVRRARAGTRVPVTTADDFNFWRLEESKRIAAEVDFVVTHIYAMWGGLDLDRALDWTRGIYAEVKSVHPYLPVVIGEAGWATRVHDQGEQAKLIKGEAGEDPQKRFYEEFTAWTEKERIIAFYFEAFDENWKGGEHPNEVEKHWGLFRADRTAKQALAGKR